MANENLKVNANSSVLEHKRKHNLLVEKIGFDEEGNINFNGNFSANEIVENMSGYSYVSPSSTETRTIENIYAGIVKNGNKLTMACALNLTILSGSGIDIYPTFVIPSEVANKLYPTRIVGFDALSYVDVLFQPTESGTTQHGIALVYKSGNSIVINLYCNTLNTDTKYYVRFEQTFLLSDNLIPETQGD